MCEAGDEKYVPLDLQAGPTVEGIAARDADRIAQAEFIRFARDMSYRRELGRASTKQAVQGVEQWQV